MVKSAPSTSLVVRLVPLTVIEPLRAMYLASACGARLYRPPLQGWLYIARQHTGKA